MSTTLRDQIQVVLNISPKNIRPLSGGMIGTVYRVELANGHSIVAKVATDAENYLDIEGYMLRYLAEQSELPIPEVLYSSPQLLLIELIEGHSAFTEQAQRHAAELLAELHTISASAFGLERSTLIGPLHQPNPWIQSWVEFFRDHRLLYMANEAYRAGKLPQTTLLRLEKLAERLEQWLQEPTYPSLIHGDIWTNNVLAAQNDITGFLDPAIYYADSEIELAFIALFNTFGTVFFEHYHQLRPIAPGFMETRCDLYNLYPLLVHVRLFGGGYLNAVESTLRRFGF